MQESSLFPRIGRVFCVVLLYHFVEGSVALDKRQKAAKSRNTTPRSEMVLEVDIDVVLKTIFLCSIAAANLVGNSCVCLVVFKDERLRSTPRNTAVASLAISDLLMLQVIFLRICTYYGIGTSQADSGCEIAVTLFPILINVSFLHLAVLSLDRYLAILYPLRYSYLVTQNRIAVVLAVVWFIPAFTIGIVPIIIGNSQGTTFRATFIGCAAVDEFQPSPGFLARISVSITLYFVLPALLMLVSYVRIGKEAWRQTVRIHSLEFGGNLPRGVRHRGRDMKWAKTMGIVTGAFILCYFPIMVVVWIRARSSPSPAIEQALEAMSFLTYTNSVLNPIIYSLRSYEYRNAFKKICSRRPSQPALGVQAHVQARGVVELAERSNQTSGSASAMT